MFLSFYSKAQEKFKYFRIKMAEREDILIWLDFLVFMDKNDKTQALSPASSLYWLTGEIKNPHTLLQKVGNTTPSAIVYTGLHLNQL